MSVFSHCPVGLSSIYPMFAKCKSWMITLCVVLPGSLLVACSPGPDEMVEVTRIVRQTAVVEVETVEVTRVVVETIIEDPGEEPLPEPASKDLVVCLPEEPASLFVYADESLAAQAVRHALFTNYITTRSFAYQADGLQKIPSLADGDAVLNQVEVSAGQTVLDANGEVVILQDGVSVVTADGETAVYAGAPLLMDQLIVNFTMEPTVWSDGTPVSATDSVYAFQVGADPGSPTDKHIYARTANYEAVAELQTRWTGLPGFRDDTYFLNFWNPLPAHVLAQYVPSELPEVAKAARAPIGDGPFQVVDWVPGEQIRLEPNEFYYREGLPYLDSVTFRFVADTNQLLSQLLAGQCDIVTQDGLDIRQAPFLLEAEANGLLTSYFQTGTVYEHIDFGINPYPNADDLNRPDWFEDARVRQAMVMCTDRQRMVDEFLYGRSAIMHSYIPDIHPLYPAGQIQEWPHNVQAANALLDEVGFVDTDGDGIREYYAAAVPNNSNSNPAFWDGTPFKVTLTTNSDEIRQQLVQIFRDNMRQCGIDVELSYLPTNEWFADGPGGPLFGRRFDLGHYPWKTNLEQTGFDPLCYLYQTAQITGPVGEGFGSWNAFNVSGWSNAAFDDLCDQALDSLPGTEAYEEAHRSAQIIFAQELPIIPLFLRLKVAAARPDVLNFGVDTTQPSELYNLYEIDFQR